MRWDQSRALGAVGVAGLCAGLPPQSPVDKPLPAQRLFLPDHVSLQAGQVGFVGGRPGDTSAIWASQAESGLTPLDAGPLHLVKLCIFAEGAVWDVRTLQQE